LFVTPLGAAFSQASLQSLHDTRREDGTAAFIKVHQGALPQVSPALR
jgi:hypothetical protein